MPKKTLGVLVVSHRVSQLCCLPPPEDFRQKPPGPDTVTHPEAPGEGGWPLVTRVQALCSPGMWVKGNSR